MPDAARSHKMSLPADLRAENGRWVAEWAEFGLAATGATPNEAAENLVQVMNDAWETPGLKERLEELAQAADGEPGGTPGLGARLVGRFFSAALGNRLVARLLAQASKPSEPAHETSPGPTSESDPLPAPPTPTPTPTEDGLGVIDAAGFAAITSGTTPVLVDFWASWCGPCRALTPVLVDLAAKLHGRLEVVKVDVEAEPELAARLEISGVPTLMLYREGKLLLRLFGARGLDDLLAEVEPLLA